MRQIQFLIATLLLSGAAPLATPILSGQDDNEKDSRSWTSSPFDQKVFIENKGQFDGSPVREQVLYGIQNAGETILFTSEGVNFVYPVGQRPIGSGAAFAIRGRIS